MTTLLPIDRIRTAHTTDTEATRSITALRKAGLTYSDIARLCGLGESLRGALSKLAKGEGTVSRRTSAKLAAGYARYLDGDRSYVRKPVPITISNPRKRAKPAPKPKAPPETPPEPVTLLGHVPTTRDRLRAARRENRRAS